MNKHLHLIIETTAFFAFSVFLCSLTFLGAAGVDPFSQDPPQVQQQAIAKGNSQ